MKFNRVFRWLIVIAAFEIHLSLRLFAQSIELPNVKFIEPPIREFQINDSLHFHIQTDIPPDKLRARVFWGRKQELVGRVQNAPAKSCVYFPSFVIQFDSANGEVKFGWQFKAYS